MSGPQQIGFLALYYAFLIFICLGMLNYFDVINVHEIFQSRYPYTASGIGIIALVMGFVLTKQRDSAAPKPWKHLCDTVSIGSFIFLWLGIIGPLVIWIIKNTHPTLWFLPNLLCGMIIACAMVSVLLYTAYVIYYFVEHIQSYVPKIAQFFISAFP